MKTLRAVLLIAFVAVTAALAAAPQSVHPRLPSSERLPGVDLTEGISQVTGVAISPMLGVSALGAWRYYHTPESKRHRLPWFCHPVAWGIGFFLIALCLLKDFFGAAAPALVKKPLDMAELIENKLSALVASVAFLPFLASQVADNLGNGHQALRAAPADLQFASLFPLQLAGPDFGVYLIVLPLCIVAFLIVWLTAHCINVLIALSPFVIIDTLLKLTKTFLLSAVVVSYLINPYFGAAVSLVFIGVAAVLAPWAFRLTVFGTILASDIIVPRRARRHARPGRPQAFLARRVDEVPVRTFGYLTRSAGVIRFEYRPWLILPRRSIEMPRDALAISRGVLFPALLYRAEGTALVMFLTFAPRYRGLECAIAAHFHIDDIRDGPLLIGLKAVRAWLGETIGPRKTVSESS